MPNPFSVLGITPKIIRKMNNNQISELVKSSYRTLSKIYHPDYNPKGVKKMLEILEAYKALEDQNSLSFRHYKDEYLKVTKSEQEILILEREISRIKEDVSELKSSFSPFLIKCILGASGLVSPNIFDLKNCVIPMSDYVMSQNRNTIADVGAGRKKRRIGETADQFYEKETRFEIIIDGQGKIFHHRWSGSLQEFSDKKLIGVIRRREGESEKEFSIKKILKSLDKGNEIFTIKDLEKVIAKNALVGSKPELFQETRYFENRMKAENLIDAFEFISFCVPKKGDFLLSLSLSGGGEYYLSLEGFLRANIIFNFQK